METVQRTGSRRSQSYKRRLLSYILCMALVLGLAKPPPAKASFSLTAAAVGSVVAIFMASVGFTWAADNMDSPGFQDVMVREIQEFLDEVHGGLDILSWIPAMALQVTHPGHLSLSKDIVGKFVEFAGWFEGKFFPDSNSAVVSSPTFGFPLADGDFFLLSSGYGDFTTVITSLGTLIYPGDTLVFSSGAQIGLTNEIRVISPSGYLTTYCPSTGIDYLFLSYVNSRVTLWKHFPDERGNVSISGLSSFEDFVVPLTGGLVIDKSDSVDFPAFSEEGQQAYDLTIPGSVATDVPGILDNAVDLILEGSVPITGEVVDVSDTPIEDTKTEVGDIALEDIQKQEKKLGAVFLSKFPFCIPWDLARAVQLLAAPAQTPRWEVDFFSSIDGQYGIDWKGDTTIVIDFSEFELLGQISRWTSTFMFVWMLIYNTKRLIMTA